MIAIASVMFLLAVAVTIAAAFLIVEKDRGFLFWLTTGFAIFVELAAYSLALGLLTAKARKKQISTPMVVVSWVVLVVYAVVGVASIIIYSAIRDADRPADKAFGAVLMIETAVAFLLVLLFRSWDLFFQAGQPPIALRREEHRAKGLTLQPLLVRLRAVNWGEPVLAVRADKVLKRLDVVQSALMHSHGGGIGTREAGQTHIIDPVAENGIQGALAEFESAVAALEAGTDIERQVVQVESIAGRLQGFVSALQLD
jgi:hypothetical protein